MLLSARLYPQIKNSTVTEIIMDKSFGQPVEFATVQLLKQVDSTLISTIVTNKKGRFGFNKNVIGNYILRVSFYTRQHCIQKLFNKKSIL